MVWAVPWQPAVAVHPSEDPSSGHLVEEETAGFLPSAVFLTLLDSYFVLPSEEVACIVVASSGECCCLQNSTSFKNQIKTI